MGRMVAIIIKSSSEHFSAQPQLVSASAVSGLESQSLGIHKAAMLTISQFLFLGFRGGTLYRRLHLNKAPCGNFKLSNSKLNTQSFKIQ